jgi:hypothetical protein
METKAHDYLPMKKRPLLGLRSQRRLRVTMRLPQVGASDLGEAVFVEL